MIDKNALLTVLTGDVCPVCTRPKVRFRWTCSVCYNWHLKSDAHRQLSDLCDAHLAAAEAFLEMARRHGPDKYPQQPESD